MNTSLRNTLAGGVLVLESITACGSGGGSEPYCESPRTESGVYPGDASNPHVDDHNPDTWENGAAVTIPSEHLLPNRATYMSVGYKVSDHDNKWHDSEPLRLPEERLTYMAIGEHSVKFSVRLSGKPGSPVCDQVPNMVYFGPKTSLTKLRADSRAPVFNG